jgi:hypothetical protein
MLPAVMLTVVVQVVQAENAHPFETSFEPASCGERDWKQVSSTQL